MQTIRLNRVGLSLCSLGLVALFLSTLPGHAAGASKAKTIKKKVVAAPKKTATAVPAKVSGAPFTPVTRVDPQRCGIVAYLSWPAQEQASEYKGVRVKFLDDGRDVAVKTVGTVSVNGVPVVQTAVGAGCKTVWIGISNDGPTRIAEFQIDPVKELRSFAPFTSERSAIGPMVLSPDGTQIAWSGEGVQGPETDTNYVFTKNLITGTQTKFTLNAFVFEPVGFTADSANLFIQVSGAEGESQFQNKRLHRLNLQTQELTVETLGLPPESAPATNPGNVQIDTLGTIVQFQSAGPRNAGVQFECVLANCGATLVNRALHDAKFRVSGTEYFVNLSEPIPNGASSYAGALPTHIYNCGAGSYAGCKDNPVVVFPGLQLLLSVR
jgi:hypothetical protein